ncbi:MAG: hypothetical protein O7F74_04250 [Bacteroidetes bacterium]|nr:hypothetical protein [Bacteroidota bacterium]
MDTLLKKSYDNAHQDNIPLSKIHYLTISGFGIILVDIPAGYMKMKKILKEIKDNQVLLQIIQFFLILCILLICILR